MLHYEYLAVAKHMVWKYLFGSEEQSEKKSASKKEPAAASGNFWEGKDGEVKGAATDPMVLEEPTVKPVNAESLGQPDDNLTLPTDGESTPATAGGALANLIEHESTLDTPPEVVAEPVHLDMIPGDLDDEKTNEGPKKFSVEFSNQVEGGSDEKVEETHGPEETMAMEAHQVTSDEINMLEHARKYMKNLEAKLEEAQEALKDIDAALGTTASEHAKQIADLQQQQQHELADKTAEKSALEKAIKRLTDSLSHATQLAEAAEKLQKYSETVVEPDAQDASLIRTTHADNVEQGAESLAA